MKTAYCTIASANYLPRVLVLEESLKKHNPEASFHILLCERPEICLRLSAEEKRHFISPPNVCANWLQMAFYYDITEYNTALKPFLLEYLIGQGYEGVFYFDPDIEVFGSFKEIESLLSKYDLILTPHMSQPLSFDGLKPGIDEVIRAGQFNLGFVGITAQEESARALKWWAGVCQEHCLFDVQHRFFVDQFWAAALPSFVQKFYCLRDSAYNMAYWNVFQRKLDIEKGRWVTDSGELKFFHFSGLADDLTKVSRHQNRISAPEGSPLYTLLADYRTKIATCGWAKYSRHPYSFSHYTDNRTVSSRERRMFLALTCEQRSSIDDPFASRSEILALWRAMQRKMSPSLYRKFLSVSLSSGYWKAVAEALRYLVKLPVRALGISKSKQRNRQ